MSFIPKATPKVALAAALGIGLAAAVVATPAVAQKKPKGEAAANGAPELKLSEPFRKVAQPLQAALAAGDPATIDAAIATATPVAKTDDEKYFLAAAQLPYAAKGTDRTKLIPLLDQLIANPRTPAANLGQFTYLRGALAFEKKNSAEALPYFKRARELGYTTADFPLQYTQALIDTGDVQGGVAELQKAIDAETAAGRKAPQQYYDYAIAKLYTSGNKAEANSWLKRALVAYPSAANWRKSILIYRDGGDKGTKALDRSQRLDLYRLMRITKALADRGDYLEYADIAYQAGLPTEAIRMIGEGKASGAVPAADGTAASILAGAQNSARNEGSLEALEKQAATAANGKTAAQTGDAYFASGNFAKAVTLYRLGLQKGSVDTGKVNLHLGMALAQAGQLAEAKTAFAAVTAAPDSEIAGFWVQWIDLQGAPAAPAA